MIVLIMEDDLTMVEMLKSQIHWSAMGIDRILSTPAMPEARTLMSREAIHLMLLDIEVIRGTGIELLHWARTHGYDAPCVFLTNHASFDYAQEAVRLGSVDYVLKTEPVHVIEAAIRRAAAIAQPEELFAAGEAQRQESYREQYALADRTEQWTQMLLENRRAAMLNDVRLCLSERTAQEQNAGLFMVIQHDFTQAIYRLIKQQGIAASEMYRSEEDTLLYRNAVNSQFDLLRWINRFSTRAQELLKASIQQQSVAGKARAYIDAHYAEDLSRQSLAERFYVTADHLSHLFNKETGLSIPDYITRVRVDQAKRLLLQGQTVSEAAQAVGYDNFAYFSTVFKRQTGETPSEYRKAHQGEQP